MRNEHMGMDVSAQGRGIDRDLWLRVAGYSHLAVTVCASARKEP